MALTTYPASLPQPRVADFTPTERRMLSTAPSYFPNARPKSRDRQGIQNVEFIFQFNDLPTWRAWLKDALVYSGAWFDSNWPIPLGGPATRRFLSPPTDAEYLVGLGWRVQATVQIRGIGEQPTINPGPTPFPATYLLTVNIGDPGSMVYGGAYGVSGAFKGGLDGAIEDAGSHTTVTDLGSSKSQVEFQYKNSAITFGNGDLEQLAGDVIAEFTIPGAYTFGLKVGMASHNFAPDGDLEGDIGDPTFAGDVPCAWYAGDGTHRAYGSTAILTGWPSWNPGDVIAVGYFTSPPAAVFFRNGVAVGAINAVSIAGVYFFCALSVGTPGGAP